MFIDDLKKILLMTKDDREDIENLLGDLAWAETEEDFMEILNLIQGILDSY